MNYEGFPWCSHTFFLLSISSCNCTNPTPPQHCMVGGTWSLSEQMQEHCYPKCTASALTSQLNYKMTFIRPMKVLVYFVCTYLFISNSMHYLLYICGLLLIRANVLDQSWSAPIPNQSMQQDSYLCMLFVCVLCVLN